MNRLRLNVLIDVLSFISTIFMISTGFVLRYVLPAGSGRLEGAGLGQGAMVRPITLLWTLTRHEWGDIHYWASMALLVFLSLHLFLHWRWIVCMVKGQPSDASGLRVTIGTLALLTLVAFAIAPFLSPTARISRGELLQQKMTEEGRVK